MGTAQVLFIPPSAEGKVAGGRMSGRCSRALVPTAAHPGLLRRHGGASCITGTDGRTPRTAPCSLPVTAASPFPRCKLSGWWVTHRGYMTMGHRYTQTEQRAGAGRLQAEGKELRMNP